MPDPKGIAGYGVLVQVAATTVATTATVAIGGVIDVSPPPFNRDMIDVSTQDSVGGRDFIPVPLPDNGEISYEMNWVPGNATADLLETLKAEVAPRVYTQTYTQVTPHQICTYSAFLTAFEVSGGLDDKKTGSATFKITGAVTWADAA